MKQDTRQDRKDMAVGCVILLAAAAAGIALLSLFATDSSSSTPATPPAVAAITDTPSSTASLIDDPYAPDDEVQGYWYCWTIGPLMPHHLGYRVPNDHLCTWGELRSSGFAG